MMRDITQLYFVHVKDRLKEYVEFLMSACLKI